MSVCVCVCESVGTWYLFIFFNYPNNKKNRHSNNSYRYSLLLTLVGQLSCWNTRILVNHFFQSLESDVIRQWTHVWTASARRHLKKHSWNTFTDHVGESLASLKRFIVFIAFKLFGCRFCYTTAITRALRCICRNLHPPTVTTSDCR